MAVPSIPSISVKAYAELIHTPLYGQARILHDQKYPSQVPGKFKVQYYKPTLDAIRMFFRRGNNSSHFPSSATAVRGNKQDIKTNNFRAMQAFLNSSQMARSFSVCQDVTFKTTMSGVTVRVTPDLIVLDQQNVTKYLMLDCSATCPDQEFIDTVLDLSHHTLTQNGSTAKPRDIEYIHLESDHAFSRQTIRQRTLTRAVATAQLITSIWNTI